MLTSLGTLRSQEGNSEEDVDLKMCLSSHSASQLKFSLTYVISVEFQMETLKKILLSLNQAHSLSKNCQNGFFCVVREFRQTTSRY